MKRSPLGPGKRSIERGSTFEKPRSELRRSAASAAGTATAERGISERARYPRGRPISQASPKQRRKVMEIGFCIVCGEGYSEFRTIDPAHLVPRGRGGCDDPLCVVPLCRTFEGGCHREYDEGRLDLLKVIAARWPAELGEVRHALEHLRLVELVEQLANDRVEWRGLRDADLLAAGDQLQSAASRMAAFVLGPAPARAMEVPYEVHMAALEAQSAIDEWTEHRARTPSQSFIDLRQGGS